MSKKPLISIVIVNYLVHEALVACLRSIEKTRTKISYEILVVDNDEIPILGEKLKKDFPQVRYIPNHSNTGFGAANNKGVHEAKGKYLFFLNPDTHIRGKTIEKLYIFLQKNSDAGIAAPLLYHPDGTIFDKQGVTSLTPLRALFATSFIHRLWPNNPIATTYWMRGWRKEEDREVAIVPGTAFMIRKALFERVGGFDETFFLYFEEFDLCRRIKRLGYRLFMVSGTKVVHFWGESTKQREDKDLVFRKSQEYYFKKYYGLFISKLVMGMVSFNKYSFLLLLVLFFGLFLRLYKITTLFMLIGDFGWFYLSAYDMIMKGIIPLVSIPSSVVWLHQGPLATYLIALSLWVSHMNPVAPAVFFSVLDVLTIYLVFLLGKKISSRTVGISAAFLYATSPLVLINVRMPYHTAPIPFFTCSVFLLTLVVLEKRKYYFWLFFLSGLLLQLELSNSIIFLIFFFLFLFYREKIKPTKRVICESIVGLLLGIFPFILYDFTHHFTQTLGFPLWVVNRVRLFLGLTTSGNATTSSLPKAMITIWEHIARILFPSSESVVFLLLLISIIVIGKKIWIMKRAILRDKPLIILLLWTLVPLVSFMIHAAPGDAYFPFLFPALVLLTAYSLNEIIQKKVFLLLSVTIVIGVFNAGYTLSQDYFLSTLRGTHYMPPHGYNFGQAYFIQNDVARKIAEDANGQSINLHMGGYAGTVKTGGDQFKYLLLIRGVILSQKAKLTYTIYDSKKDIPKNASPFYRNKYYAVTKTGVILK